MASRMGRNVVLGLLAFCAGLMLQCLSDRKVSGDGGILDQMVSDHRHAAGRFGA